MEQTNKVLEQLEGRLKYQWSLVAAAHGDEIAKCRARALETYQQLKKYRVQVGVR